MSSKNCKISYKKKQSILSDEDKYEDMKQMSSRKKRFSKFEPGQEFPPCEVKKPMTLILLQCCGKDCNEPFVVDVKKSKKEEKRKTTKKSNDETKNSNYETKKSNDETKNSTDETNKSNDETKNSNDETSKISKSFESSGAESMDESGD